MAVDPEAAEVKASGGVVWRRGDDGLEIVVVHRPRYDDWSLPKGKLDKGESWEEAALREVEEEIGLRCRLGDELEPTSLPGPQGPRQGRALLADGAEERTRRSSPTTRSTRSAGCHPRTPQAARLLPPRRRARPRGGRAHRVNRERFPGLAGASWARLDGPAGTQMVDTAIEAMDAWMRSGRGANHGGAFAAAHATDELVASARASAGALLGAPPAEIVFGFSMTALTMAFAGAVGRTLEPGDEIVCTRLDHDANVRPWVIHAERNGATVRFAEPDRETLELPASAVEAVLSERTRWVAVTHASNAVGTIPDLAGHRRRRPRAPARASTSTPCTPPRTAGSTSRALGCDALACSRLQVVRPAHRRPVGAPGAARRAAARQAPPLPRHAPRPLGERHAAVRGAGRRRRGRRLHARHGLGRGARPRGRAARRRARGPRRDPGRHRPRPRPRPHLDADVHRRRATPPRRSPPRWPSTRSPSGTATTTPTSSSASSASTPTAPSAPASCTTTTRTTSSGCSPRSARSSGRARRRAGGTAGCASAARELRPRAARAKRSLPRRCSVARRGDPSARRRAHPRARDVAPRSSRSALRRRTARAEPRTSCARPPGGEVSRHDPVRARPRSLGPSASAAGGRPTCTTVDLALRPPGRPRRGRRR